jgi:hypothetical protein
MTVVQAILIVASAPVCNWRIPTLFRAHLKCSRPSDVSFVSDCILVGSAQLRRTWLRSRLPSFPWSAAPEGFAHYRLACIDETTERTIAPAARTAMPVLQLGHWIDAKRRERAYKRQDKKSALGAKTLARQTRMNHYSPNALFRPMLTPAVRDLAALHDYSEGSHEANARQCNSGRGVARRPR